MTVGASESVLRFLDDLRAAEAAGAEVLAAWIAVCGLDGLRGGLRAIGEREAAHAELLEERLRELGGVCTAAVAETVRTAALACFGSPAMDDEEKLALFLARYPDDAAAAQPILAVCAELAGDPETQELLRLIAEGEVATVAWFRAYQGGLRPTTVPDASDQAQVGSVS
ncbi:MAG TPA: ferritin-like domain-containing protein [Candidatus Nitrosopolaris sp.]|nr:ferritin-like domain-containing protein [Candidatus Nitrosopolaris sp.]